MAVDQRARPRRIRATESTPPARVAVAPRTIVLFVAVALGAVVLLAGVYVLRTIVIQLIVAVVLAMAAEPLVRFFVRRGAPRGRAVGISFALVAIVLSAFGYLLARPLVDESTRFVHDAPALVQHLSRGDGRLGFLETRFHVVEHTRDAVDSGRLTAAAGPAWGAASSAVQTAGALIFIAFLTLFVQLGGRQWFESLVGLAPERNRARIRRAGSGISTAVGGYVNGNLLISVIAGTVTTLTLLALAGAGAEVTLAVRNTRAGAGAAADITATTSNAAVHVAALDLADPRSVAAFIAGWSGPLDILINNAGVMAIPNLQLTPEGWELQFATNHLGHFALAVGLHDALVAAGGGARIVSLSSRGHLRSPVVFDDINFRSRPYDPLVAYGQSKTANVLFAVGANRRWSGDGITANSVHPGAVDTTNLSRHIGGSEAATSRIATRLRSSRRRPRRAPATALQPTRSIPRTPIDCGSCRKAHSSERH